MNSRSIRWLIIPGVVGLIVLLGFAVSAEPRPEPEPEPEPEQISESLIPDADQPQDDPSGTNPQAGSSDDTNVDEASQDDPGNQDGEPDQQSQEGSASPGSNDESSGASGSEWVSFDIRSDDGSIGVRIDDGPMTAFPRPNPAANEASELTPQPLIDDTIDDQAGYRLDPTGQLRPVTADQIQPGDLVVQPVDGGIDIVRADRGRTEIRPEGTTGSSNEAGDEFAVTEIGADGVSRIHQPDANGQVHLDDGVTVQMPTPRPSLGIWERVTTTPWRWIVLGFVLLALSSIGVALYLHFNRPEPFGPGFVGQDGVPVNRFDEFLAMLAADPDPARAIRLAFAAAERGLGSLPARHETETPFEWSARVTTDHAELDHPLSNLCSQFATARFAPHRPSSADRDLAVDELRLLADLADYSPDHTRSTSTDPLVVGS